MCGEYHEWKCVIIGVIVIVADAAAAAAVAVAVVIVDDAAKVEIGMLLLLILFLRGKVSAGPQQHSLSFNNLNSKLTGESIFQQLSCA